MTFFQLNTEEGLQMLRSGLPLLLECMFLWEKSGPLQLVLADHSASRLADVPLTCTFKTHEIS